MVLAQEFVEVSVNGLAVARLQAVLHWSVERVSVGGVAFFLLGRLPGAFIPNEDQGVLFVNAQLDSSAIEARCHGFSTF